MCTDKKRTWIPKIQPFCLLSIMNCMKKTDGYRRTYRKKTEAERHNRHQHFTKAIFGPGTKIDGTHYRKEGEGERGVQKGRRKRETTEFLTEGSWWVMENENYRTFSFANWGDQWTSTHWYTNRYFSQAASTLFCLLPT